MSALPYYSPTGDNTVIKYLFSSLDPSGDNFTDSAIICDLPLKNVNFTLTFNQAGPFSATFSVEQAEMNGVNWRTATAPGKSFLWIEENGVLIEGYRVLHRHYSKSQQTLSIDGQAFYSYWTQRLQAADYGSYVGATDAPEGGGDLYNWWKSTAAVGSYPGVPAPYVAWQVLIDAQYSAGQLANLSVPTQGKGLGVSAKDATDPRFWDAEYGQLYNITYSAPKSQQQTVDSIVQDVVGMGWTIGVDVGVEVAYEAGVPVANTYVYWPRKGIEYIADPSTSTDVAFKYYGPTDNVPVLDLSQALDIDWDEDATSQSTGIVEQIGANGNVAGPEYINTNAINNYNYPLTEQAISHVSNSNSPLSTIVLDALRLDDAAMYSFPQEAPVVTIQIGGTTTFGFSLQELVSILGNDIVVYNPIMRQTLAGNESCQMPPPGYVGILRITSIAVTIADAGVSTAAITLNKPPSTNPLPPTVGEPTGAAPSVTGLSVTSGPPAGGTSTTITGTGFSLVTGVYFGGVPANAYTKNSTTSITAAAPPGSAGTVNVTVATNNGTSAISGADHYTYT